MDGATDAQVIAFRVEVTDIYGGTASFSLAVGLLRGDVNGDGIVNPADVNATAAAAGAVTASNFRYDVNLTGVVNKADLAQVRTRAGNQLP